MPAPTRRSLLRIIGSLLTSGFLAGCIGTNSGTDEATFGGTTTEAPTPIATPAGEETNTTTDTATSGTKPERIEDNETVTIGSPSDFNDSQLARNNSQLDLHSQTVTIRNIGSFEQAIGLTLSDVASEGAVFDQTYMFAPDATLDITIYDPGNYSGVVRTNSDREAFDLPPFDCNNVGAGVEVAASGSIDAGIASTLLGCPSISEPNETTPNDNDG